MAMLISTMALYAQKDVTKFLGIPVDGSESEMVKKLKEKGFRSSIDGMLEVPSQNNTIGLKLGNFILDYRFRSSILIERITYCM